jgi:hypothetical protein
MQTDISKPTWYNLKAYYSYHRTVLSGPYTKSQYEPNPMYEPLTRRRYNYSKIIDTNRVRIVFLSRLAEQKPDYKTLIRDGKPLWCHEMRYEGIIENNRAFSFRLDGAKNKRFVVTEDFALLIPQRVFIDHTVSARFTPRTPYSQFGSVFRYDNCRQMMYKNRVEEHRHFSFVEFCNLLDNDCQIKVGNLVKPRVGLFSPTRQRVMRTGKIGVNILQRMLDTYKSKIGPTDHNTLCEVVQLDANLELNQREASILDKFLNWCMTSDEVLFPFGLVIARESSINDGLFGKELYTVRFGPNQYDKIHPIELEVVK